MKIAAIIAAAGNGSRIGGEIPKQFRELGGKSMLAWSVAALRAAGVETIVAVIDPTHRPFFEAEAFAGVRFARGGATRTASVRAGLASVAEARPDIVLIHDAARPGLTPAHVAALAEALTDGIAGAAPALPVTDALKRVGDGGQISADVARADLVRVQTPQAFRFAPLLDSYARLAPGATHEDDLAVVRAAGYAVATIVGDPRLMKATYPEDFALLDYFLGGQRPHDVRVGAGYDAHRFAPGDHVTLCGVRIAHDKALLGHSDADAGWHALTDAILGALGAGDIGDHFPPSDPRWRGAASDIFLRHAADLAAKAGARITHVDVTLICERPKIAPHRDAMRARTAEVLNLTLDRVSVKATTTERLGFTGREEGLAAQATATLALS